MLMNLESCEWDDEMLAVFDLPRAILPEIRPSSDHYGVCRGVLEGTPFEGT